MAGEGVVVGVNISAADRWTSLVGSVFMMLTCGTMYLFSAFSGDLAELMGYNTTELNNIGTCGMVGAWAAVFAGLFVDKYGPKIGTYCSGGIIAAGWIIIALCCQGYLSKSSWAIAGAMLLVGQGSGFGYLSASKAAYGNFHFDERGTLIGGLVCFFALCGGIYAQTYRVIFRPYFGLVGFFWAMGLSVLVVHLACAMLFAKSFPSTIMVPFESNRMHDIRLIALALAGILCIASMAELMEWSTESVEFIWVILMAVLVFLGFAPYWWPKRQQTQEVVETVSSIVAPPQLSAEVGEEEKQHSRSETEEDTTHDAAVESTPTIAVGEGLSTRAAAHRQKQSSSFDSQSQKEDADSREKQQEEPGQGVDEEAKEENAEVARVEEVQEEQEQPAISFEGILRLRDYWTWVVCYTLSLSFGIVVINNLATLVASTATEFETENCGTSIDSPCEVSEEQMKSLKTKTTVLVALYAVFNTLGRVVFGPLADRYRGQYPRVFWMAVAAGGISLLGNVWMLLFFSFPAVAFGTILSGIGLGCTFAIAPLATSELFGLSNFGFTWGLTGIAAGLGTILLSTILAGRMTDYYTEQEVPVIEAAGSTVSAPSQPKLTWFLMNGHRYCLGWRCYQVTFSVTAVTLMVSAAAALLIVRRVRDGSCKMYK